MADRPGLHNTRHHQVSRHTMTIRRAKEEDAKRLAESEEGGNRDSDLETRKIRPPAHVSRAVPGASGPPADDAGATKISDRRMSGRTVIIQQPGSASQRLTASGRGLGKPASVRVTGGDTIIRYESGDMVIKRGTRRAELRRQIIWAYALGYLALFGLFGFFLLTGTTSVTPQEFVDRAFAKRHGESIVDLERAAYEAMRGNRTPAEVRLAESLSFYDENKDLIHVDSGDRLTLLTAAKLGKAIIEDQKLEPTRRTFAKPIRLYKETYLANAKWPFWLTLYNSIGFFLLVLLFLWRPIRDYLGTQGKKTAGALRNAREAQDAAQDLRERYRQLASDLDARGGKMKWEAENQTAEERESALARAKNQADMIAKQLGETLAIEESKIRERLGANTARDACAMARGILEKRLGQNEHDTAIEELIADIAATRTTA